MNNPFRVVPIVIVSAFGLTALNAEQTAHVKDYARVVGVEPVYQSQPAAVRYGSNKAWWDCVDNEQYTLPSSAPSGGPSIGEDIRRQLRRARGGDPCGGTEGPARWGAEVEAYRVTYRYAGKTGVLVLPYHPGNRVEVDLRIDPVP